MLKLGFFVQCRLVNVFTLPEYSGAPLRRGGRKIQVTTNFEQSKNLE